MPNKEKDSACRSKKMHIGNDFVTIVYDDSDTGYQCETITVSDFIFLCYHVNTGIDRYYFSNITLYYFLGVF